MHYLLVKTTPMLNGKAVCHNVTHMEEEPVEWYPYHIQLVFTLVDL